MREFLTLLAPQRVLWPRFAVGVFVACASVVLGVALFALVGQKADGASLGIVGAGAAVSAGALRLLALSRTGMRYLERLLTHDALFRGLAVLRVWLFRQLIPLSPARLSGVHQGDLLARLTSDVDALDGLYLRLIVPCAVMLFVFFGLIFVGAWPVIGGGLLYAAALWLWVKQPADHVGQKISASLSQLKQVASDGIEGLSDILAVREQARFLKVLHQASARLVGAQVQMAQLAARAALMAAFLTSSLMLWPLWASATPGFWTSFFMMLALGEVVALAPGVFLSLGRLKASAHRLTSLIEQRPVAQNLSGHLPEGPLSISFESVSFGYQNAGQLVLDDFSFSLPAGDRMLVTGPSGAGKSTIAGLLLKFWEPKTGAVRLGSVDVSLVAGDEVRRKIGYLMQDQDVVSGSLRENLLLANRSASDGDLLQALSQAGLGDLLSTLPEGLETWVGENGAQLSGGQARRVAVARLLLKQAPVWVCDEPTEGLDANTAREVLGQMIELAKKNNTTLVLITHQPDMALQLANWKRLQVGA